MFLNFKITFGERGAVSEFQNSFIVSEFENNFWREKIDLSFLIFKITFGFIVSEFQNNFWREKCRGQYDSTKPQ